MPYWSGKERWQAVMRSVSVLWVNPWQLVHVLEPGLWYNSSRWVGPPVLGAVLRR